MADYAVHHQPMQDFYFTFRPMAALATALSIALFIHLGNWQADKARTGAAAIAQFQARAHLPPVAMDGAVVDAAALRDMPIVVRGRYIAAEQFFLDNQQENGVAGVAVITPLEIAGSSVRVLVNRGWIGWGSSRAKLPAVAVPQGEVEIIGQANIPSNRKFFLMPDRDDVNPRLWSRIDLVRYAAMSGKTVQPLVILQNPDNASDTLVRDWLPPEDRVGMNKSYSFQWYGMAAALLVFFGVTSWRKRVST